MPVSDLLKDLPSFNANNFALYNTETANKTTIKKPSVYIATTETTPSKEIVSDRTNILLRYLHLQWQKKNMSRKREFAEPPSDDHRKRPRFDEANSTNL
ncbi:DET1- and DDB1-associated protein 1-like [Ctenocephalides felis]|uniref:DET1- and DDB1-associated protein 1-like n=1 Tax=Ctenocephalides felis TaxID=7515 RepID=UPI000E6E2163|nr:DET1- and DDB1-associated protein 1-like [Ctenocephalides felis]XP_026477371.1 DET1- and DDB1-associated protein 1-like [Ctenocephalides felis]